MQQLLLSANGKLGRVEIGGFRKGDECHSGRRKTRRPEGRNKLDWTAFTSGCEVFDGGR